MLITNLTFFYMELKLNGFEEGKSITWGTGKKGLGHGNPRNGSCPPQNHYVPGHININSYLVF